MKQPIDINTLYERHRKGEQLTESETTMCKWYEELVLDRSFGYRETMRRTDVFDELLKLFPLQANNRLKNS